MCCFPPASARRWNGTTSSSTAWPRPWCSGRCSFPSYDATVGTLASFATFAVGFLARPFGGLFFGHFGDRWGRKPMLVATLLLVGGSTFLIGLLPTYAQVGVWAPILLLVLRLMPRLRRGRRIWRRGGDGGGIRAAGQARPVRRFRAHGHPGRQRAGRRSVLAGRQHGQGFDADLGLAHSLPGVDRCCWAWASISAPR